MPHARLTAISTEHAKATGLAMASAHKLGTMGLPAAAMAELRMLTSYLDSVANLNAEMGPLAATVSADEATAASGEARDPANGGKGARATA